MNRQQHSFIPNKIVNLIVGLLLLLPFLFYLTQTHIQPALRTFELSQMSYDLLREPEVIGNENFERLEEDPRYQTAWEFSESFVSIRIAIVAIALVILGVLIGIQRRTGRTLNRFALGVLGALLIPMAFFALWSVYQAPLWGTETSPIFPDERFSLADPITAPFTIQFLDGLFTLSVATVVGGLVYIAVLREPHPHRLLTGFVIWIMGMIVAGASAFLIFDSPFFLTRGGPVNSTLTLVLSMYETGFARIRFGYASAQGINLILGAVGVGALLWLLVTLFRVRLRISPSTESGKQSSVWSVVSIPLILLMIYPFVSLILWGNGVLNGQTEASTLAETINFDQVRDNSLQAIPSIWVIHLPITILAGFALGFLRPLGRIGTQLLFLPLLVVSLIPMEALLFAWFENARDLGILNSLDVLNRPWLINGFSLLVFKLVFDGAYDSFQQQDESQLTTQFILRYLLAPAIGIGLIVGAVMSFLSTHSMLWNLISQNERDNFNLSVTLVQLRGFSTSNLVILEMGVAIFSQFVVPFALIFGVLFAVVLEPFSLVGGWLFSSDDGRKPKPMADVGDHDWQDMD